MADEAKKLAAKRLSKLRQRLISCFSEEELHDLCFELGLEYESLPGKGKAGKAREVVEYFERRNRIPELVRQCARLRPDVPWEESLEATEHIFVAPSPQITISLPADVPQQTSGQRGCALSMTFLLTALFATLVGLFVAGIFGALPLAPSTVTPDTATPPIVAVISPTPTVVTQLPSTTPTPIPASPVPTTPVATSTRAPTSTPMPTITVTRPPLILSPTVANEPRSVTLYSPVNGAKFITSVITFKWSGDALQPGETFMVEIIPALAEKSGTCMSESDYGNAGHVFSPPLTDHQWTTDITAPPQDKSKPCTGRIEWRVHIRDAAGNVIQSTPRSYFEWNPS